MAEEQRVTKEPQQVTTNEPQQVTTKEPQQVQQVTTKNPTKLKWVRDWLSIIVERERRRKHRVKPAEE